MDQTDVVVAIGGAAGDGVASAGKTLALSMARQGLAVYSYNSYQSVIRGGHSYLRLRISAKKPLNQGDQVDILIALNQDTLDRHLQELAPGGVAIIHEPRRDPSPDALAEFNRARAAVGVEPARMEEKYTAAEVDAFLRRAGLAKQSIISAPRRGPGSMGFEVRISKCHPFKVWCLRWLARAYLLTQREQSRRKRRSPASRVRVEGIHEFFALASSLWFR